MNVSYIIVFFVLLIDKNFIFGNVDCLFFIVIKVGVIIILWEICMCKGFFFVIKWVVVFVLFFFKLDINVWFICYLGKG